MKVLSSVEAILIRAVHASQTISTYLSDVSLDTAVELETGSERSTSVEICRCPIGYSGTSCEVRYYTLLHPLCVISIFGLKTNCFRCARIFLDRRAVSVTTKTFTTSVRDARVILTKKVAHLLRTRGLLVTVSLDTLDLHAIFQVK